MQSHQPMDPGPSELSSPRRRHPAWRLMLLAPGTVAFLLFARLLPAAPTSAQGREPTPDPYLRLATPVIPANPSEADRGSLLYWYHCMPCHGDRGQGLTAEWRAVWVDDHQNCWARGCHAGRPGDGGFPIPRSVPAVIGASSAVAGFAGLDDLAVYLRQEHPPQRPGALTEEECHALAAFLLKESGRLPSGRTSADGWALSTLGTIALVLCGLVLAARRNAPGNPARDGSPKTAAATPGHR